MEKIEFTDIASGEPESFYVLEQTTLSGSDYLLVSESGDPDAEVIILQRIGEEEGDITYELVTDDGLLKVLLPVFQELFDEDEE